MNPKIAGPLTSGSTGPTMSLVNLHIITEAEGAEERSVPSPSWDIPDEDNLRRWTEAVGLRLEFLSGLPRFATSILAYFSLLVDWAIITEVTLRKKAPKTN